MDKSLKTVTLYGPMRKRFGRKFELAISNTREAIHALSVQVPGFKKYLFDAESNGLRFAVFIGNRNINEEGIDDPAGNDEIRIAPIIQGSKRGGLLQTIVGGALIALSFVPIFAPASSILLNMGVSMALGGVVQMLTRQPTGLGAKDSPENQPSYSMDGAVNTQAQGNPVPLCYGRVIIGGAIISGAIISEDLSANA